MALALRFTCDEPGCRAFLHTAAGDDLPWSAWDESSGWVDGTWSLRGTGWVFARTPDGVAADVEGRWLCPTHARAIDAPTAAEA
jgi:hypothetical protein